MATPEAKAIAAQGSDSISVNRQTLVAAIAQFPEDVQDDLIWLHGYAAERLRASRRALADATGYDWTTIYRVWTGSEAHCTAQFLAAVRDLRLRAARTAGTEFIPTVVTERIWAACDRALTHHEVTLIVGASGRSKTHAVREWQLANNHGRAIYLDCPVSSGSRALALELAGCMTIGRGHNTNNLWGIINKSLDHRNCLIVDEAARLLPNGRSHSVSAIEELRRLHDLRGLGLVLVATKRFQNETAHGQLAMYMEQLNGRVANLVDIPDRVSRTEAAQVVRAFVGDEPSPRLLDWAVQIANDRGRMRLLFHLLRNARLLAQHRNEPLTERHLELAVKHRKNEHVWPED